jgi:hypothetical protein
MTFRILFDVKEDTSFASKLIEETNKKYKESLKKKEKLWSNSCFYPLILDSHKVGSLGKKIVKEYLVSTERLTNDKVDNGLSYEVKTTTRTKEKDTWCNQIKESKAKDLLFIVVLSPNCFEIYQSGRNTAKPQKNKGNTSNEGELRNLNNFELLFRKKFDGQ